MLVHDLTTIVPQSLRHRANLNHVVAIERVCPKGILRLPRESRPTTRNLAADSERLDGLHNLNVGLILSWLIPEPGRNVLQPNVSHFRLVSLISIDQMLQNELAVRQSCEAFDPCDHEGPNLGVQHFFVPNFPIQTKRGIEEHYA